MKISTIVCTTAFQKIIDDYKSIGDTFINLSIKCINEFNVDLVIGDPKIQEPCWQDENKTIIIPITAKNQSFPMLYGKVDGAEKSVEEWKKARHPEYPLLTFLLAKEY